MPQKNIRLNSNTRKEIIADKFKEYFEYYGFKKTNVSEVAKELKISKKTIYKEFSSKEKIYYYLVKRGANFYKNKMENTLKKITKRNPLDQDRPLNSKESIEELIKMIFSVTKKWLKDPKNNPFEFKYKYRISQLAFQNAYEGLFRMIISNGIDSSEYREQSVDLALRFLYGIMKESFDILHTNHEMNIEEETIRVILNILK